MLKMNKKVVFLGTATGKTREQFHEYYLKEHCPRITADENVLQYYANNIVVPSQALIDAGWGWGGYGQYILGKPANGIGDRAIYQPTP